MVERLLIAVIRIYQHTLARLTGGQCRYHPTCSEYAVQALRANGAVRGSGLALWRVLRCGPWTGGGVDYPPERRRPVVRAHG